jgi:hypothetical protein
MSSAGNLDNYLDARFLCFFSLQNFESTKLRLPVGVKNTAIVALLKQDRSIGLSTTKNVRGEHHLFKAR